MNLLDDCPILGLMNADDKFLLRISMALSILANDRDRQSIVDAMADAMAQWAAEKGFTE